MADTGVTRTTYVNVLLKDAREKGFQNTVGRRHNLLSAFQKKVPDKVVESLGGSPFKSQVPIMYRSPYGYKQMGPIGSTSGVAFSDATSPLATMSEWNMMVDSFRFMFDDLVIKAGNKWSIADHVTNVLEAGRDMFNCIADTKLHTTANGTISVITNDAATVLGVGNIYLFQGLTGAVIDGYTVADPGVKTGTSRTITNVNIATGDITVSNADTFAAADYIGWEGSHWEDSPKTTCQFSIPDALAQTDIAQIDNAAANYIDYGAIDRTAGVLGAAWKGAFHNFAGRGFSFSEFDQALWELYVNTSDNAPNIAVMNERVLNRVQAEHRRDLTKIAPGRKALNEDISGMPYLWYGNELLLILDPKVPGARDVHNATVNDGEIWVLDTKTFELQQIGPPELAASRTMYPNQDYPVTYSDMFWVWNLICKMPSRNLRCYGIDVTL